MDKQAAFNQLFRPVVAAMGYEFVGCEFHSSGRYSNLRLYIDKDGGVTSDDCAKVSHQISALLDIEDPISSQYMLEVSSPGVERPLFTLVDFERFLGCVANVGMRVPVDGRRQFKGRIKEVSDEYVTLIINEKEFKLLFSEITKANLVEAFDDE